MRQVLYALARCPGVPIVCLKDLPNACAPVRFDCRVRIQPRRNLMTRTVTVVLGFAALIYMAPSFAIAQNAPPTYQADPSVYKVIFEDENFRVIAATWKAGETDKSHSHPVPSVVYAITGCSFRLQGADGKTREVKLKKGAARAVPITASHTATNTGPKTCRAIFVERK
jgi:hypothetical protein